jgi:3-methylfumaryl-CoA hydratase
LCATPLTENIGAFLQAFANSMHTNAPHTLDAETLAHLQTWIGRTQTHHDQVTAAPLNGLWATLDHDEPYPQAGQALPPLGHWLYFLPQHLQREIGADGHPRRGGFLPPVPLPRRMWAGGRLHWSLENPLRVGQAVTRHSRIASVSHKAGRSGDLVFVRVQHEFHNAQGLSLREEHDIVYRAAPGPQDPVPAPQAAPVQATWQDHRVPDAVMLFRYSALTFNGHRIHYDHDYVTREEGYPGLVVHGPLIATLLLDLARRQVGERGIASFAFKAVRPVFDQRALTLLAEPAADGQRVDLWARDHEGWLAMQATLELA